MQEAGEGINKNRVVDNLDDLDKEFCATIDTLLALYRRIQIRAHQIEEENPSEDCPICHGQGATTDHHDPCTECGGSGKVGGEN